GLGLRARGHEVIVATGACYRERVEALGLGFRPLRPDCGWVSDAERMRPLMDLRWGLLRIGRDVVLPALRDTYEDTFAAAVGADLLVSHALTGYSTRLVSEKTGIRWASTLIVPLGFFSACDPSVLCTMPWLSQKLRFLGRPFWGPLLWLGKRATRFLARPWYELRADLGLPPTD